MYESNYFRLLLWIKSRADWLLNIGVATNYCIARYTDVWNRHWESKKTKLYEIGSVMKLFNTFELKVIRHEERETQSFYANCFYIVSSQPNQRATTVAHKVIWPRPALKLTFFFRGGNSTHCFFSNLSPRFWCVTSPKYPISIWDFYFDISE